MSCVNGGFFYRGSNEFSFDEDRKIKIRDEFPYQKIYLSTFLIDKYEVTASEYEACVKSKKCSFAKTNYRGYSNPKQPKLGISWYQARDYCLAQNKRLPTEAEWEKAARGETGDIYPWGNEPANCSLAIIEENNKKGCETGKTWDIASRKAFRYGLFDMAGNSWEWVNDWYSEDYEKCGSFCSKKDPKGPCNGADNCSDHKYKIVKGGSWWWPGEYAKASNRRAHVPSNSPYHHFGFRCAMSIPHE